MWTREYAQLNARSCSANSLALRLFKLLFEAHDHVNLNAN